MVTKRKPGYLEKFLKRADKAIDTAIEQGIRRADEILEDAVELGKLTSKEAQKRAAELRKQAEKESKKLKIEGEKKLNESISTAKKITSSKDDALETLAKLGELRKAGIITEKEFKEKKKKILSQI